MSAVLAIALFACQDGDSAASHRPPALNMAVFSPTVPSASPTASPATPSPQPTRTPGADLSRLTQTIDLSKELETGHLHRRNGDYSRAIARYKSIIDMRPNSSEAKEAQYWLGRTYLLDERYELAAQTFHAFLRNYSGDEREDQIAFFLATCERELGHSQKALEYYQTYASKQAIIRDYVNLQMANIYVETQDLAQALQLYESVQGDDIPSWLQMRAMGGAAQSYLALNDYEKALYCYGELLKRASTKADQATFLYRIGAVSEEAKSLAEAKEAFWKIVVAYPSAAEAQAALEALSLIDPAVVNQYQRGMVYYHSRRNEEALSSFQRYVDSSPQGPDAPKAHYYTGLIYWRMDYEEKALTQWGKLIELYPQDDLADDALWERASLLEGLSRYGEAIEEYRLLEEQYPFSEYQENAIFRQGLCYFKHRDYEGAKNIWTKQADSFMRARADTRALFWLGKLLLFTGESEQAKTYLERAQSIEPKDYYALRAQALYVGERVFSTSAAVPETTWPFDEEKQEVEELERWLHEWALYEPYSTGLGELSLTIREDPYFQRGEELLAVGLRDDAGLEFRQLIWRFWSDPVPLYQLSMFLRDQDLYQLSILCADRVLTLSRASIQQAPLFLQKLVYPAYFADLVIDESAKRGFDPLLLLCLIRQESMFDHYAISSAQARGLTQVIPTTGRYIAESLGRANFQNQDLYRPYVSIEFGAWYLAWQLRYFDNDVLLALAAYNAGPGNVDSWLSNDAKFDIDLFVEDIPFLQTETYVKKIYQYYELYKAIHASVQTSP